MALYLDASYSMKGYVVNPGNKYPSSSYQRVLNDSYSILRRADSFDFYKFGTKILPVPGDKDIEHQFQSAIKSVQSFGKKDRSFYDTDLKGNPCSPNSKNPGCINQESDIAEVLQQVSSVNGTQLSVVVSDLFLSTDDISSFIGALVAPAKKIFSKGDVIGLIGVSSRFDGNIYDLGHGMTKYKYMGQRPFYLMVVGTGPDVYWFIDELQSYQKEDVQFKVAVFDTGHSTQPETMASLKDSFGSDTPERISQTHIILDSREFKNTPQYIVTTDSSYTIPLNIGLNFKADNESKILSRVPDKVELDVKIWKHEAGSDNCLENWQLTSLATETRYLKIEDDKLNLNFAEVLGSFGGEGTFFVDIRGKAAGRSKRRGGIPGWFDKWGYEEYQVSKITKKKPAFFPTLNLKRVADEFMRTADLYKGSSLLFNLRFAVRLKEGEK
jgi:hypothetical protein